MQSPAYLPAPSTLSSACFLPLTIESLNKTRELSLPRGGACHSELWVAAGLLLYSLMICLPSLPGRMNADAIGMYAQAIEGTVNSWHWPGAAWLWYQLGPQPMLIAAQTVLVALGIIWSVYRVGRYFSGHTGYAIAVALIVPILPPVYGYLTAVSKDTWVACGFMLIMASAAIPSWSWRDCALRAFLFALCARIRPEVATLLPFFLLMELTVITRRLRPRASAFYMAIALLSFFALERFENDRDQTARRGAGTSVVLIRLGGPVGKFGNHAPA